MKMASGIGIVDLFAGPGGLGEGFTSYTDSKGKRPFQIKLSVEKEPSAHCTLQLRSFFRAFGPEVPDAYYEYVRGEIGRNELFERYPAEAEAATAETLQSPRELGVHEADDVVRKAIRRLQRDSERLQVVIGGPPCQAYSLVGRARNRGIAGYVPEHDKRHFLYQEYLKILSLVKPSVFVMENVKGLLSCRINGEPIFPAILADLSNPSKAVGHSRGPSYKLYALGAHHKEQAAFIEGSDPRDFLIRSELYGIPQIRHRIIVLGVHQDIAAPPPQLVATTGSSVGDALRGLPPLRSGLSRGGDSPERWHAAVKAASRLVANELREGGMDAGLCERATIRAQRHRQRGGQFIPQANTHRNTRSQLSEWLYDSRIGGVLNHETRGHLAEDLARYLYSSCYAKQNSGDSPRSSDFPASLAPNHANWLSGKFADRFKVQTQKRPSSTVTSHISKDGHYFIHHDPAQCRSLTVREAARLQTFPDNYFFEGNRTQQFVQVGNAVPPLLANKIAQAVYSLLG